MKLWDNIKNILIVPEDDELEDDVLEQPEEKVTKTVSYDNSYAKRESTPRIINKSKSSSLNSQMQVILVKPDRYDDVTSIADHLNEKKTVVLNLETADSALSRRIVDFLSGVAYANHGNMRKVSKGTFLIVPNGVDMMGEVTLEDFDDTDLYL